MPLLLDLRDQNFADQNQILSRHELPALGCTRRLDEAETASLYTPRRLPTRKVHRRDLRLAFHKDGVDTDGVLGRHNALTRSHRLNELRDVFFLAEDMPRRVKAEVGFSIAT